MALLTQIGYKICNLAKSWYCKIWKCEVRLKRLRKTDQHENALTTSCTEKQHKSVQSNIPKTRATKPTGNCDAKMVRNHGAAYSVGATSFTSKWSYRSLWWSWRRRDSWYICTWNVSSDV